MAKNNQSFYRQPRFYGIIGGVLVGGILLLWALDSFIMPAYTNYGEGVTVPNITQISVQEAEQRLASKGLRYEVAEKRSNEAYPADFVIDQNPAASNIVKPNRKIYLTVNALSNARVTVPQLKDLSLRNALIQIENAGLKRGTISYESSRFKNTVLRQSVASGSEVLKGTSVNLTVSDGLGETLVAIPDIAGLRLAEAQQKLREAGLRIGEIDFRAVNDVAPNVVLEYSPRSGEILEGKALQIIVSERAGGREQDESGVIINNSQADSTRR